MRALEDPWRRVESRENLIYLVFCDILCGCPRGIPFGGCDVSIHRIEGSTRRWEADADAMRVALAAHDKVFADGD